MRRTTLFPLLCAVLVLGSAAVLAPASGPNAAEAASLLPAGKRVTFRDATRESRAGPDITRVTVSNDDAGRITFRVDIPTRPKLIDGMRFRIWIDADDNAGTGLSENGMDFFLHHERGETGLYRCGVTSCLGGSESSRTLRFSYAAGPRFTILGDELGHTKRFRFVVEAATGVFVDPVKKTFDFSNAHFDDAPARGRTWAYALRFGPQKLLVERIATAPAIPGAGRPYTVRMSTTRTDARGVPYAGRVACSARIAGEKLVARSQQFVERTAVCVFDIPSNAAGRTIQGTIAVSSGGENVARAFSARIR